MPKLPARCFWVDMSGSGPIASEGASTSAGLLDTKLSKKDKKKSKEKDQSAHGAVTAARKAGVPVETASKHDLNTLVDNRPHQVSLT